MILEFDLGKMRIVEKEFNGTKSKRMEFTVKNQDGEEKIIEFSRGWVNHILPLLERGFKRLEIQRRGEGMDTQYSFIPA